MPPQITVCGVLCRCMEIVWKKQRKTFAVLTKQEQHTIKIFRDNFGEIDTTMICL